MSRPKNTMEIFKCLEKSNCRECGEKTCLAFAGKLKDLLSRLDVHEASFRSVDHNLSFDSVLRICNGYASMIEKITEKHGTVAI